MQNHEKEIGGYFEFDLPNSNQFPYNYALRYNSARSAFYDLLQQSKIKYIWMPKYICDSMLEPLIKLNIKINFYNIDENFFPILTRGLKLEEYFFYVNYFGICTSVQKSILELFPKEKIIFDHSQAFFIEPFNCFATIYSPRKFLPIAEGGLLVTERIRTPNYSMRRSEDIIRQYDHCFIRKLENANNGYKKFVDSEESLSDCIPRKMSQITNEIINSLDYLTIKSKRIDNFNYLHNKLSNINDLPIDITNIESPLTYPLLLNKSFSKELIENKVFSPTYWKECLKSVDEQSFEYKLISNTTHLVCDQRYSAIEMQFQINKIKDILYEY